MPTSPPSTRTVIERALDETIARLSRLSPTPDVRGFLIEARRLTLGLPGQHPLSERVSHVFLPALQGTS